MVRNDRADFKVFKNVFDQSTLLIIEKLISQGHIDELKSPIALGKEANVFSASKGEELIIAKIYRVQNCNFNNMYGYLIPDPRYTDVKKRRRLVIFSWVQREYRNLLKAREVIRVPKPIAIKDNVLLMEFIGFGDEPAPKLKDCPPTNPEKFFNKTIANIKALYNAGLVHADLSDFNILNHDDEPVFIDFSQSTTIEHPQADDFLKRDIKNIVRYFKRVGIKSDEEELYGKVCQKNN